MGENVGFFKCEIGEMLPGEALESLSMEVFGTLRVTVLGSQLQVTPGEQGSVSIPRAPCRPQGILTREHGVPAQCHAPQVQQASHSSGLLQKHIGSGHVMAFCLSQAADVAAGTGEPWGARPRSSLCARRRLPSPAGTLAALCCQGFSLPPRCAAALPALLELNAECRGWSTEPGSRPAQKLH